MSLIPHKKRCYQKTIFHTQIGKSIQGIVFTLTAGRKPKCCMCGRNFTWMDAGVKLKCPTMSGHLSFCLDCYSDFIAVAIELEDGIEILKEKGVLQ